MLVSYLFHPLKFQIGNANILELNNFLSKNTGGSVTLANKSAPIEALSIVSN